MKEGWKYLPFEKSIVKVKKQKSIKSKDYKEEGQYPVVSQESLLISGYFDDASILYQHDTPVVIFGDHTQNVKYVDFDFIVGADGVHILSPIAEITPKFFYYQLKSIKLRNLGYARHYKLLKQESIGYPPLPEQECIVSLLDAEFAKVDAIKANAEKQLQEAKALFQSALKDYLTPKEGWEEKYLHEISSYYNGLTYKPTDVSNTGTIVLRSSNIQNNCLSLEDKVKVSIDVNEKLKVHKGDIIMCSRNGSKALIGKVALIPYEYSNLTFGTFMMIIKSALNPYLYFYFLSENFKKQIWKGEANMINQITRYMLDEVLVQYPKNEDEQRRIVKKLHELSAKIQSLQSNFDTTVNYCNDLKQSILKDIFS